MKDPAGATTCCEYDLLGRISRICTEQGMEVRYRYDCLNRPEQITYGNGIVTHYQYDADGNVITGNEAERRNAAFLHLPV